RDGHVTGVQTCALPISPAARRSGEPGTDVRPLERSRGKGEGVSAPARQLTTVISGALADEVEPRRHQALISLAVIRPDHGVGPPGLDLTRHAEGTEECPCVVENVQRPDLRAGTISIPFDLRHRGVPVAAGEDHRLKTGMVEG